MAHRPADALGPAVPAPSLARWGISPDADLLYRNLASRGPQAVKRMAADLGMSQPRVLRALEELHTVRIAMPRPPERGRAAADKPATRYWAALPVDAAVSAIRHERMRRVGTVKVAAASQVLLRDLNVGGASRDGVLNARFLPDRRAARSRIAELVAVERDEHLAMNPERVFSAETLAIATPMDLALLTRGVRLDVLGSPPADGGTLRHRVEPFSRSGGDVRLAPTLPYKMMIFDRQVALVAIDPLHLDRGALEIREPAAVAALVGVFRRHWATAVDPGRNGVPPIVLTPREKAIVALLAEGHTDVTVGARLGLSTRSVTYTLRALMDRLGVENRFQLGLALGEMHAVTLSRPPHEPDNEEGTG